MSVIVSIHLANTVSGAYDVRRQLPKPMHCDADDGTITRGSPSLEVVQVVGFALDPEDFDVAVDWDDFYPMKPDEVIGTFPVVATRDGGMATLILPVSHVTVTQKEEN